MSSTHSQVLVILGLVFEFVAVLLTVRRVFWGYSKDTLHPETNDSAQAKSTKAEGALSLGFLSMGMVLQVVGILDVDVSVSLLIVGVSFIITLLIVGNLRAKYER